MEGERVDYWQLAREVCEPREYELLTLYMRRGLSKRQIALALNLSRTTVTDVIARAERKVARASQDAA